MWNSWQNVKKMINRAWVNDRFGDVYLDESDQRRDVVIKSRLSHRMRDKDQKNIAASYSGNHQSGQARVPRKRPT